jgi:DNA-binding XRE family transcriptional regulator
MARLPNNELRQLRRILRPPGGTVVSQKELAKRLRISAHTIKKIEAGYKRLSTLVKKKITAATSARWDGQKWIRPDGQPFQYEDYSWYQSEKLNRKLDPALDQAIGRFGVVEIHCRIEWLFKNIPGKSWDDLKYRFDDFLEKCKREFKLNRNDYAFFNPVSSATDSDYARFTKVSQQKLEALHQQKVQALQKREHASSGRGQRGAVAGDEKRERKYGP